MAITIAAIFGAGILVAALFLFIGRLRSAKVPAPMAAPATRAKKGRGASVSASSASSCPLCSTALGPGERIKSDIFPGRGDRIMRIFGCPHCLPPSGSEPRLCPVCGRELPSGTWAVARYFERPGRRHVHVLGCGSCHPAGAGGGLEGKR